MDRLLVVVDAILVYIYLSPHDVSEQRSVFNGACLVPATQQTMQGNQMTQFIDGIFFQDLARMDPGDVCRRASCRYDDLTGGYAISVWGDMYEILPNRARIECAGNKAPAGVDYFALFAVHYLLKVKEIEPSGEWVSEKDIPGGSAFFRGPHLVPTQMITRRFENNLDAFKTRCEECQGRPLDMADAAYGFEIAPRMPVAVLYWTGDADFPAESKILYDRTIAEHLALDVIYALAVGVCQRMGDPTSGPRDQDSFG